LFAPIRSSPVSIFSRENFSHWLKLSDSPAQITHSPDTKHVLDVLMRDGALFFNEIVNRTRLLPSRAEQALAELAAQGLVTSDSFEGLRALLTPQEKRQPFADVERKRRHKSVTSVEYAGRWSLLRPEIDPSEKSLLNPGGTVDEGAVEMFARVLLRRYGIVFRRLLEGETLKASWYELGRVFRKLEARGEIRGGYFVAGVSGEQFALPEAVGMLRSFRKSNGAAQMITVSGVDPLNLAGILAPGRRIAAITSNRVLFRDGIPVAALEAGKVNLLDPAAAEIGGSTIEHALVIGTLPLHLRKYYA
jgi:ATP-dependent Lhr-like helicase